MVYEKVRWQDCKILCGLFCDAFSSAYKGLHYSRVGFHLKGIICFIYVSRPLITHLGITGIINSFAVSSNEWLEVVGMYAQITQSCPTLCNPVNPNPPGSSVHGIFQARLLEWVAISYSRISSQPRDRTHTSCISCIGRKILYHCTTWVEVRLFVFALGLTGITLVLRKV